MKNNLQVARMSSWMGIIAVIGGVLAMFREILIAKLFGLSRAVDAFYISLVFPEIAIGIITTTFASIFIPVFCRLLTENDRETASRGISNTLAIFFFLSCAIGALFYLFNGFFLRLFFSRVDGQTIAEAGRLAKILAVYIPLGSAVGLLANVHFSKDNFRLGSASSYFVPLATVALLLVFSHSPVITVLPAALVAGTAIQMLVLFFWDKNRQAYFTRDAFCFSETSASLKNMAFFFFAITISQFGPAIDRTMASWLVPGSVACLSYANKLVVFPINLVANSIVTVLFPFFAFQTARDEETAMIDSLTKTLRVATLVLIPLTLMLLLFSDSLITLLYRHGKFDSGAKDMMVTVFNCYSLQIFFYTCGMIMVRCLLALQEVKTMLVLTFISFFCNVAFNLLFMQLLTPKVAGIALSTSFVHLQGALLLFIVLRKRFAGKFGGGLLPAVKHGAICAAVAGLVVYGLLATTASYGAAGNIAQIIRLTIVAFAGAIIILFYYMKIARISEIAVFLRLISTRLFGAKQA